MTDSTLFTIGCGVSFTFLAGCYVYLRQSMTGVGERKKIAIFSAGSKLRGKSGHRLGKSSA